MSRLVSGILGGIMVTIRQVVKLQDGSTWLMIVGIVEDWRGGCKPRDGYGRL
jgi:hypothetical protein